MCEQEVSTAVKEQAWERRAYWNPGSVRTETLSMDTLRPPCVTVIR